MPCGAGKIGRRYAKRGIISDTYKLAYTGTDRQRERDRQTDRQAGERTDRRTAGQTYVVPAGVPSESLVTDLAQLDDAVQPLGAYQLRCAVCDRRNTKITRRMSNQRMPSD